MVPPLRSTDEAWRWPDVRRLRPTLARYRSSRSHRRSPQTWLACPRRFCAIRRTNLSLGDNRSHCGRQAYTAEIRPERATWRPQGMTICRSSGVRMIVGSRFASSQLRERSAPSHPCWPMMGSGSPRPSSTRCASEWCAGKALVLFAMSAANRRNAQAMVDGRRAVPAQTAGVVPGAQGQASARRRCDAVHPGRPVALSRLASVTADREAGDADPLASTGIPTVLALEVTDARSACDFTGRAAADRDDGGGESDVGRRTHRQRAPAEAWHSAVAAYGAAIHAVTPAASEERDASMEHLRTEPRPVGPRE